MRDNNIENGYEVPLLEIGPFGGLDPTTEPFFVAETNFVDGINFIPNEGYGGFVTVKGRNVWGATPLPGLVTGMTRCDRDGLPEIYIFAVTVGNIGYLYSCLPGASPVLLPTPVPLSPNLQTSFAAASKWIFLTNGVDVPLKIEVSTLIVSYWGIVAPTVAPTLAPSGGSGMVGVYYYSITFGNVDQESSQGTISLPVTVVGQGVQLTGIPVSADAQVTQRNIYRIGGTLGQWRLIATLNDNVATTYLDTTADNQVTGQQLTIERDPPNRFKAICTHMERIWGFGTPTNASIVYYSNLDEPWGFNNLTGNLPVGENSFNDVAVGLVSIGGTLVLNKSKTTYGVNGNSDSNFIVNKLFDIGCRSQQSITSAYGIAWWISRQGIYMFDGSAPQNVSDGGYQKSNIKAILDGLDDNDLSQAVSFVYQRMFHISFPTINRTYLFDTRSNGWYPINWALQQVAYNLESTLFPVVGTNLQTTGQVDKWFAAGGDFGAAIISSITSKISDSNDITTTKLYRHIEVEAPTQVATMFFQTVVNPGGIGTPNTQSIDLSTTGPRHQLSLPQDMIGTQVQLTMSVESSRVVRVQKYGVYGWPIRAYSEND